MATSTLKILRELNDYTQEYVGEEILGISQNTYSRLEQHPEKLNGEQAKKLADLYKINVADLFSESTPVITFKGNDVKNNTNGINGYLQTQNIQATASEVASLRAEIEFLRTQNIELLKLVGKNSIKSE